MIEEIYIRDLGVIKEAKLPFGPGLTVLTGETGAGKTMVLTALGLLIGARADASSVRKGQDQALVEGRWVVHPENPVVARVIEAGGSVEAGELIINRSVGTERSRSSAGGVSVPAGVLAELGENLVVVHGQADQIRLKSAAAQRSALDTFAGQELALTLEEYARHFNAWRSAALELKQLKAELSDRILEAERLREAVTELEQADPQPGEDQELANEAQRLTHAEDIRMSVAAAHEALSSEGFDSLDAVGLIGQARRALEQGAQHDSDLAEKAETLKQLGFSVTELAAELSGYLAGLEGNTASQLELVQQRRAVLASLVRKYGPDYESVLEYRTKASLRLVTLDSSTETVDELEKKVSQELEMVKQLGERLSTLRRTAAEGLAASVTEELQALAMNGASLVVSVNDAPEYSQYGKDLISIQLSAYPGAEPRPLGKGASGGELSRIMLAIEVVLAQFEQAPTFVFDEVDAGVGGAAAIEVGKRLARLAKQAQVIVVTHLAQVAAYANHHLRVLKSVNDEFTASDVILLDSEQRVSELTRMLAGLSESASGREHASELLAHARQEFSNL